MATGLGTLLRSASTGTRPSTYSPRPTTYRPDSFRRPAYSSTARLPLSASGGASLLAAMQRKRSGGGSGDAIVIPEFTSVREKPRSLFGQFVDTAKVIPAGVGGIVKAAGTTAIAPFRLTAELGTDLVKWDRPDLAGEGILGGLRSYAPLPTGMVESGHRTAQRFGVDLSRPGQTFTGLRQDPIGHVRRSFMGEYKRASDEGRILETALEDIGNLSMFGGGAARVLGRTSTTATVPVRVAAALDDLGYAERATAAVGAGVGDAAVAARPLRLPSRRGVRQAARQARRDAGPAPTVTDPTTGQLVPATRTVTIRGTGIAGRLEGRAPVAAARTAQFGEGVRRVARMGEVVDRAQFAWPAKLAAAPFKYAGRKANVAGRLSGYLDDVARGTGVTAKFARSFTDEGRQAAQLAGDIGAEETARTRQAVAVERAARDVKLPDQWKRVALNALDERFYNIVDQYAKNRSRWDEATEDARFDTQLDEYIDRQYEDRPETERPTAADIRNFAEYRDGNVDPELRADIEYVMNVQRGQTGWRTQQQLEHGNITPDQLGDEYRESVVDELRGRYERVRDKAQREWEPAANRALRDQRVSDAQAAINRTLPPPPDVKVGVEAGRNAGRAAERERGLRREHDKLTRELQRAVDDYIKLDETDSAAMTAAAAHVEQLTGKVDELQTKLRQQERQLDAMAGLQTADAVLEERSKGRPETTDAAPVSRKEAQQVVNEERDAAVEAADLRDQWGQRHGPTILTGKVRDMIGGKGATRADLGGNYDHWVFSDPKDLTKAQRRRLATYERMGFLTRYVDRGEMDHNHVRRPIAPDEVAQQMRDSRAASIDETMGTGELLDMWFDSADRVIEAQKGINSDAIADAAAERLGIDRETLRRAMDAGGQEGWRAHFDADAQTALDTVRDDYMGLDQADRDTFDTVIDSIEEDRLGDAPEIGDEGFTDMDLLDVVDQFIPDARQPDSPFATLMNAGVDLWDAVEFMRTGDVAESIYVPKQVPATMAQRVQRARVEGQTQGTRRRLSDAVQASRAARRTLDRTAAQEQRNTAAAARAVDHADAALEQVGRKLDNAEATAEANTAAAEATTTPKEWKRRKGRDAEGNVTTPLSPAERAIMREGILNNKASQSAVYASRKKRALDRWNQRITGLRTELGRRWQDRIDQEVNRPAVAGMRRLISNIAPRLGEFYEGSSTSPPSVDGLMGRLADKYGFTDELVDRFVRLYKDGDTAAPSRAQAFFEVVDEAGIEFDGPTQTLLNDSWQSDWMLEQITDMEAVGRAEQTRLNTPLRVIDLIEQQEWMPDDVKSQLRARAERYNTRRANYLRRLSDDQVRAVPAPYRAVIINARRDIGTFLDMAEDYNKRVPGSGDAFLRMAEDSVTTLEQLIDAGIDPVHLIGGKVIDRPRRTGGTSGGTMKQRKTMAEYRLSEGLRPMDPAVYARTEAAEALTLLHNNIQQHVTDTFGVPVRVVLANELREHMDRTGRPMPPEMIVDALDEAGYRAIGADIAGDHSMVVPRSVALELDKYTSPREGGFVSALMRGNRAFKTAVLPFSLRWHVGNIIGNAFMAVAYGGMSVGQLARNLSDVAATQGGWRAAFRAGGLPSWAPDELANHGLSYGEHQMMWQGLTAETAATRTQSLIAKSFKVNEFFDNMFRSAVYLDKLKQGIPTEGSLHYSLNAMGNYTRMTTFERRVVREMLPFYAWLRHQTQAALRLPLESPTRAAWVYNLGNLWADPELSEEAQRMLGSRIPLGAGNFLNAGNINPFATVLDLPLNPANPEFGRGVSPVLGLPAKAIFGYDIDKQRAITRPGDTAARGTYNEPLTTSPFARILSNPIAGLGELAYVTAGELPYVRTARDLALPGNRYDTGQLRPEQYERRPRPFLTETLPAGLGVPYVQQGVEFDIANVDERFGNRPKRRPFAEYLNEQRGS